MIFSFPVSISVKCNNSPGNSPHPIGASRCPIIAIFSLAAATVMERPKDQTERAQQIMNTSFFDILLLASYEAYNPYVNDIPALANKILPKNIEYDIITPHYLSCSIIDITIFHILIIFYFIY